MLKGTSDPNSLAGPASIVKHMAQTTRFLIFQRVMCRPINKVLKILFPIIFGMLLSGCPATPKVYLVSKIASPITIVYNGAGNTNNDSITLNPNAEAAIREFYLEDGFEIISGKKSYHYRQFTSVNSIFGPYSFGAKLGDEGKYPVLIIDKTGKIYAASKQKKHIETLAPQPNGFPLRPE